MNRENLTIGAVLLAAVIVVFGVATYLQRSGPDDSPAPITGPGRAGEARAIISEIEARRQSGAGEQAAEPAVARIDRPADAGVAPVDGGAIAVTPDPLAAASSGAVAVTPDPPAAAPGGADTALDDAFERALALQAAGQLDDAQVLLFFGARRGHARSAYAYAEINDPNHHSPQTSLLAEADAFQAFRWYSAARDGGIEAATARLDALHEWAETAAATGDSEAERLLLQWEQ